MSINFALVVTCEHGGNFIPNDYRTYFEKKAYQRLLQTHRGYDVGALSIAKHLAVYNNAPLFYTQVSRLLIDTNRSLNNKQLFSEITRKFSAVLRGQIMFDHYKPYRTKVENYIENQIQNHRPVFHISVHTFTPVFNGERRNVDIGILFDPSRPLEKIVANQWIAILNKNNRNLTIRKNNPYPGVADGFTTYLRKHHPPDLYVGIELEVNQRFVKKSSNTIESTIRHTISKSVEHLLNAL